MLYHLMLIRFGVLIAAGVVGMRWFGTGRILGVVNNAYPNVGPKQPCAFDRQVRCTIYDDRLIPVVDFRESNPGKGRSGSF